MPELPEVRVVVHDLKNKIINKQIENIFIFLPKLIKNVDAKEFKDLLINEKIINVENKGKFIIFIFSNNLFLVSHLRMEGKYHTDDWKNNKNDHLTFLFTDKSKLIYNDSRQFGTFHLFKGKPYDKLPLKKLGQEPGELDVGQLYKKLQRKRIAIKTALLDQTLMAGLGNIYVNEVLWETKVHPLKACSAINKKKLNEIVKIAKLIMDKSTELGGSSIDSYTSLDMKKGSYQNFLKVHGKQKHKCPRCDDLIKKIKVNGRGTYYCHKCQT